MRNRREFIKVFGCVTGVAAGAFLAGRGLAEASAQAPTGAGAVAQWHLLQ